VKFKNINTGIILLIDNYAEYDTTYMNVLSKTGGSLYGGVRNKQIKTMTKEKR